MADGTKLPPMIIFKNLVKVPKGNFPRCGCSGCQKGIHEFPSHERMETRGVDKASIETGLFCPKSLLVMDSASSHTRKTVLSPFKQHYSTTVAIIPGGMTPLLQPADVVWNKPFKTKMRQRWIDWLAEGEKEFIKSRKCKSASYKLICRWVSQSWSEITADLICKSFADCGITKRNDDDCLYHETLLDVLQDKGVQDIEEDHTGLTDNEETDDSDED
jgi:hypothetical protein